MARGYCGTISSQEEYAPCPKPCLPCPAFAVLLLLTTEALASNHLVEGRNPIIYNPNGNEVGVLTRLTPDGTAIMVPSRTTLGMGNYSVVLSQHESETARQGRLG